MSAFVIEALKAAAPVIAVILPAVAAYFAYRSAERKPASIGTSGIVAIGGALADRAATDQYAESLSALSVAISGLSAAIVQRAATERRFTEQFDSLIDEMILIRRALEALATRYNPKP